MQNDECRVQSEDRTQEDQTASFFVLHSALITLHSSASLTPPGSRLPPAHSSTPAHTPARSAFAD